EGLYDGGRVAACAAADEDLALVRDREAEGLAAVLVGRAVDEDAVGDVLDVVEPGDQVSEGHASPPSGVRRRRTPCTPAGWPRTVRSRSWGGRCREGRRRRPCSAARSRPCGRTWPRTCRDARRRMRRQPTRGRCGRRGAGPPGRTKSRRGVRAGGAA